MQLFILFGKATVPVINDIHCSFPPNAQGVYIVLVVHYREECEATHI